MPYRRAPDLAMAVQVLRLNSLNLPGAVMRASWAWLTFEFDAKPSPISRSYRLELSYRLRDTPSVRVVTPNIELLSGDRGTIPHVYDRRHPVRLCLFLPGSGEWHRGLALADTIVPWAVEWLFHYEIWLSTGEWQGGGEHPDNAVHKTPERDRRRAHKDRP